MSGPALNPIANTAPVAPAKGSAGPRTDAPAEASAADAPAQGFATELQRKMQGQGQPDDTTPEAKAAAENDKAAATDAAAAGDNAATQLPPELAAMLAAAAQPAAAPPAAAKPDNAAPGSTALDTSPRTDRAALAGVTVDDGDSATAGATTRSANFAAEAGPLAGKGKPELAVASDGSSPGRTTEPATPAAPTNNFAAIHAAALANMRGEVPQAAAAPLHIHVAAPAGSPAWPEEVGNRVSWMVGHDESHAELTLTPPQLGKVEISITVSGDQTSAQFVAATPAARDLIEQSLPRLREILEQSGINLGQTDVGTSGQSGNSGEERRGSAWNTAGGNADGNTIGTASGPWLRRAEGLVDTFA